MTFPLTLQRNGSRLEPMNPIMEEFLLKYPAGVDLKCKITRQRSLIENNFYWAGMQFGIDNNEFLSMKFPQPDKMHKALLDDLNYITFYTKFNGEIVRAADSTDFNSMGEDEFNKYFNAAQVYVVSAIGWNPWEAMKEHVA